MGRLKDCLKHFFLFKIKTDVDFKSLKILEGFRLHMKKARNYCITLDRLTDSSDVTHFENVFLQT